MVQAIMDEIARLGGWVTNPQPLQDDRLRFEVLNDQVPLVLDKLGSWGWDPRPCDMGTRIIPNGTGAVLRQTTLYELQMPRDPEPPKPHGSETINPEEWRRMLADFKVKRK